MKKIICIFSITLIILVICFTSCKFFFKDEYKESDYVEDKSNNSNLITESKESLKEEKSELTESETKKEELVKEKNTTSTKKEVKEKTNNVIEEKHDNQKKQEVKENKQSTKEEIIIVDEQVPDKVDIKVDTEVMDPTNDPEYKELKKTFRYQTSSECFKASNEAYDLYMEDDNFFVTTCETKSYKGELVGWGVVIYFKDNTSKYY